MDPGLAPCPKGVIQMIERNQKAILDHIFHASDTIVLPPEWEKMDFDDLMMIDLSKAQDESPTAREMEVERDANTLPRLEDPCCDDEVSRKEQYSSRWLRKRKSLQLSPADRSKKSSSHSRSRGENRTKWGHCEVPDIVRQNDREHTGSVGAPPRELKQGKDKTSLLKRVLKRKLGDYGVPLSSEAIKALREESRLVSVCVVYEDMTTSYTPKSKRKPSEILREIPTHIFVAAGEERFKVVLDSKGAGELCYDILTYLIFDKTVQVIAFDLKRVLKAVLRPIHSSLGRFSTSEIKSVHDPLIGGWLLDADSAHSTQDLPSLCTYHGIKFAEVDSLLSGLDLHMSLAPMLSEKIVEEMKRQDLYHVYSNQEIPLALILAEMELAGVDVDTELFSGCEKKVIKSMKKLEAEAFKAAGKDFLLSSPEQVAEILFEHLKLPKINKMGRPNKTHHSTNEDVLLKLSELHPLPKIILKHRGYCKLLSTYVLPLASHAVGTSRNGKKIYCRWNNTKTGTGRLSSSNPNLQTLPTTTHLLANVVEIRRAFRASGERNLLISADYSQMEMRVLALLSGDKALKTLFEGEGNSKASTDVYHLMAAMAFHCGNTQKVTKEERNKAKTIVLALVYGMGTNALAQSLGSYSKKEAESLRSKFLRKFPGIPKFFKRVKKKAVRHGFVSTIAKRRRYLPDIKSNSFHKRSYADRQAINTVIQGSASDVLKMAMITIHDGLMRMQAKNRCKIGHILFQFHDELVIEIENVHYTPTVCKLVKESMEGVLGAVVRLPVRLKIGPNLGNMTIVRERSQE
ncbi:hypothetical protein AAMO2058_000457100 [Amorphochlora amoebiformis]